MPNWWIRDNEEALEQAATDTLNSFPSVEIADARIDACSQTVSARFNEVVLPFLLQQTQ